MLIEVDPQNNQNYQDWCSNRKEHPRLLGKKLSLKIDDNKLILVGENVGYKSSILHVLQWWFASKNFSIQVIGNNNIEYDFKLSLYDQEYINNVYALIESYFVDEEDSTSSAPIDWANKQHYSSGTACLLRLLLPAYFPPNKQKCFMLVDDIETHLSVEWQERILKDISASPYVEGFVITTHSPFIFHKFRKYAHGTGRFLSDKETV